MSLRQNLTPISDLTNFINRKVDVLGVVLEISIPRPSQGSDCVCIFKIIDDSQQNPELSAHIFTETMDQLPRMQSRGDLILLRKVKVEEYNGQVTVVFNKYFSLFALFGGNIGQNYESYQVFPKPFYITERDSIQRLRNWCNNITFSSGAIEYLLPLEGMRNDKFFDLVCKVLYVCEVSNDEWMLFAWDGSDAPPLSLHDKLDEEEHNPLPLQMEPTPLPVNILNQFPHIGTILRIKVDRVYQNFGSYFRYLNQWVKIRNLLCKVSFGMWHGIFGPHSKIRFLCNGNNIVTDCMRKYSQRQEHGSIPLSCNLSSIYLTGIDCNIVSFVTLIEVISCSREYVKFYCIVRVVSFCALSDGSGDDKMRLTLEDPTARIHAILCGENLVKFFESCHSYDTQIVKMKELLGMSEYSNVEKDDDTDSSRMPPWIKCCICLKNQIYHIVCTQLCA